MTLAPSTTPTAARLQTARARRRIFSPPRLLALSIGGLILAAGVLLWLPVSAAPGRSTSFLGALFTATSAVCVTGLSVVDTGTGFTAAGQAAIAALIQIGGDQGDFATPTTPFEV